MFTLGGFEPDTSACLILVFPPIWQPLRLQFLSLNILQKQMVLVDHPFFFFFFFFGRYGLLLSCHLNLCVNNLRLCSSYTVHTSVADPDPYNMFHGSSHKLQYSFSPPLCLLCFFRSSLCLNLLTIFSLCPPSYLLFSFFAV